jgi:hypothetical protein
MGAGQLRIGADRAADQFLAFVAAAALHPKHAQKVEGLGILRFDGQGMQVKPLRFRAPSALMERRSLAAQALRVHGVRSESWHYPAARDKLSTLAGETMRASWIFAAMLALSAFPLEASGQAGPGQPASGQPASNQSAKLSRYGIFVYSSLCTQGGNATGNHVVLIRDGDRDILYWYWSEGATKGPAEASPLAIDDKTGAIKFSVDTGSAADDSGTGKPKEKSSSEKPVTEKPVLTSYQGNISDDAITLAPANAAQKLTIPRVKDFSKKTGSCNPGK